LPPTMTSAEGTKVFIERLRSSSMLVLMALLAPAVFAEPRSESPNYLSPTTLVADPRGDKLYIAEHTANQVAVFDLSSGRVERVIALPGRPSSLAVSTDGARLYVTAGGVTGKIHIVDTACAAVTDSIEVGHTPTAPVLSADGKTLYVTNRFDNDVSTIDLASKATLSRMGVVREPVAAVLSLDSKRLFVANQIPTGPANAKTVAAAVSMLDLEERRNIADIVLPDGSTGLRAIATSPEGRYLYVTHILARYRLPTSQIERGWVHTNAVTIIDIEHLKALNNVLLDDTTLGQPTPGAWLSALAATGYALLTLARTRSA
jgi:YVTN family beta-propeller protein